jgi:hypothetical protein
MKTIHKIILDFIDGEQRFKIAGPGRILYVGTQRGSLCCWIEANTSRLEETVTLSVTGTGHPSPDKRGVDYVGSAVCDPFVWHVWMHIL